MSFLIGDIDPVKEIVDLQFQLHRTQKLLEIIISKIPVPISVDAADVQQADAFALDVIQKKYPSLGIQKNT